jgi:hypothetical protein
MELTIDNGSDSCPEADEVSQFVAALPSCNLMIF